jgi:hypothetical protein
MLEQEGSTTNVSRRDMLKRSAVVGGALVWATPVVQSMVHPAFAAGADGTPVDLCPPGTTLHRFKFEVVGTAVICSTDGTGDSPGGQCTFPGWGDAEDGNCAEASGTLSDGDLCMTITFAPSCGANTATALVKTGSKEPGGPCVDVTPEVLGPNTIRVCLTEQEISFVAVLICC